jgi:protein-S-isoprenylcysteine O-methyltransferase Ste14
MTSGEARETRAPLWAWIGTAAFTIVVPGTVIVILPMTIAGWRIHPAFFGTTATRIAGVAMIIAAAPLFVSFLERFIRQGHGTPAPVAPPQHLVVTGPFRYVRNPGYIAVVSIVIGEALVIGSGAMIWYAVAVAIMFHLWVLIYEEPDLRGRFGEEYERYCREVPRWVPGRGRG